MSTHILLVHYKHDLVSWLIRKFSHSYWNHVCWIWNENKIINIKWGKIAIIPNKYNNTKLYVTKKLYIKNLTHKKNNTIQLYLLNNYPKASYLKRLLTFFYIIKNYNIPFIAPTCSGYIAEALAYIGIYFNKNKKPKFITPEDIYKSKITKTIHE